jgi:hypothetical protein
LCTVEARSKNATLRVIFGFIKKVLHRPKRNSDVVLEGAVEIPRVKWLVWT